MNKHINHFIFSILLVSTALSANKWTPAFMIQYQRLGGTDISPNGNWVAYELSVRVSYTHLTLPTKRMCRSRWSPYN